MLQEKVWVLGTRTPAWVGKVRLAIFRGRKRIPLKQEALNDLESSSLLVVISTSETDLIIGDQEDKPHWTNYAQLWS
ncbi:MAG: hypothetical protein EWV41_00395 [Microcystis wesenbergii Mw_MB_S_20031200_S109]|uniref:Uncharacterized protein n=1 Tax=Microcystis wesenbergii Mw_MB_S_20031200_S109D TaxID=2486241 RepID=A0A552M8W0_9CHRO|nr:MAG: hypothetical protein EWV41_00395 [Microcystis wesenbergii Mw_MB_S_20031200_S109]TRV28896.1 MAG: hypothetical protein EWV88_02315 [Microcystis wesenbergii Mw_MB_S_20031200_S109D]